VNNLHWTALTEAIVLGDGGRRRQAVPPGGGAGAVEGGRQHGARRRARPHAARTGEACGYAQMVKLLEAAGARWPCHGTEKEKSCPHFAPSEG
jgi:hypothetical protein